jgi:hypothetical protein
VDGVIEQEFAGEIEAFVSDIDRMKQEAADAKETEVMASLQAKIDESFQAGLKAGAGQMLAILKSRTGSF